MYKIYLKHKFKRLNPRVARKKDLVMIKTKTRKTQEQKDIQRKSHFISPFVPSNDYIDEATNTI